MTTAATFTLRDASANRETAPVSATSTSTILFAGGGTGGHIFPSLAIAERLAEKHARSEVNFLVSDRPLDAGILSKIGVPFTPLPAQPLTKNPMHWPAFFRGWSGSVARVRQIIQQQGVKAVVAMGGFVSAPAVHAAHRSGVPVLLVNLDAVPGRANRLMARKADEIFTAYPFEGWPNAQAIGLPLRRSAVGPADKHAARRTLGLDPERETLLITGASQGATSVNKLLAELVTHAQPRKALKAWQVLHLCGSTPGAQDELRAAYTKAEIPARVETFCNEMGLAWAAATIAISRAGAGSVAEVWANATPTIFLPYPYHKDQHQRLNALPLAEAGAALLMTDQIDPRVNARQVTGPLLALMANAQRRIHMAELMRQKRPADGAEIVAQWLMRAVG